MAKPKRVTRKWASGILSLPSTSIGKWSASLLLLSLALMLLNAWVVLPAIEQRTGLELARIVFSSAILLCVVSTGVTGLIALVMKRERSWAVFLSILLLVLVMAFLLPDIFIHG